MPAVKKRALILLGDCQETHFLTLINLGQSLLSQGVECSFVICAHGPCPGSTNIFLDLMDHSCVGQRGKIISVLKERSLPFLSMHQVIDDEMVAASRAKLELPAGADFRQASYRGYNLWDIAKGSICRYLLRTKVTADDLPVIRRYFSAAILHLDTFPRIFSLVQPDALIIFNGMPLLDRTAREVAASLGVPVFAEENSCFADRKFLDPGGVILNRHQFARQETWDAIRHLTLSAGQRERLSQYLAAVFAGKLNTVQQSAALERSELLDRLGFQADRPLAILLAQVPIDSVIVFDSPIYTEMLDFLLDAIDVFAGKPDWGLIIRLHPIEEKLFGNPTLRLLQQRELPGNVRIVHGLQLNTYALMDCCQFALTINSQSGLEMLAKHKPVIVAGTAFYGNKGFTADLPRREDLAPLIEELCRNPELTPAQADLVDLFLYHFIFEYLISCDGASFSFAPVATERICKVLRQSDPPSFAAVERGIQPSAITTAQRTQDLYLLGMQELQHGRPDQALEAFSAADHLLASHGVAEERLQVLLRRIEILMSRDDVEQAEDPVLQLMEINAAAGVGFLVELLRIHRLREQSPGVVRLTKEFLKVNPNAHQDRFELGCLLEREGSWPEAWEQFQELLRRCPDHLDAFFHLERSGKKAGFRPDPAAARSIMSRIPVAPYLRRIAQSLGQGNLVDPLKRTLVVGWLIYRRLRD